jgi:hypothetical protein
MDDESTEQPEAITPEEETQQEPEAPEVPKKDENAEALRQVTARAKKAEAEAKALKAEADRLRQATTKGLDVEDYIGISASLEGLDQKEKEKLAREHKLTGRPLEEIRKDEDFTLWQDAYRAKKEKELSLKPSGTQSESERPMSFADKLKSTPSMADKEKLLTDAGLYRSPKPRTDRVDLGRGK